MKNVYLTGMMGSGKTTVGRALAQELDMQFLDLDEAIEEQTGKTVSEIFAQSGESYFRELESNLLFDLHKLENLVVATGGGTILSQRNQELMNHSGTIIYLARAPEDIIATIDAEKRPLLKANPENVHAIYAQRRPVYERTAHLQVMNQGSPEETAQSIREVLESEEAD